MHTTIAGFPGEQPQRLVRALGGGIAKVGGGNHARGHLILCVLPDAPSIL